MRTASLALLAAACGPVESHGPSLAQAPNAQAELSSQPARASTPPASAGERASVALETPRHARPDFQAQEFVRRLREDDCEQLDALLAEFELQRPMQEILERGRRAVSQLPLELGGPPGSELVVSVGCLEFMRPHLLLFLAADGSPLGAFESTAHWSSVGLSARADERSTFVCASAQKGTGTGFAIRSEQWFELDAEGRPRLVLELPERLERAGWNPAFDTDGYRLDEVELARDEQGRALLNLVYREWVFLEGHGEFSRRVERSLIQEEGGASFTTLHGSPPGELELLGGLEQVWLDAHPRDARELLVSASGRKHLRALCAAAPGSLLAAELSQALLELERDD